jgi:hypothetical protein
MKTMISTPVLPLTIIENRPASRHNMRNKDVVFAIVLDEKIKAKPYILLFEEGVYQNDDARKQQSPVMPSANIRNTYVFEINNQTRPLYFSVMLNDHFMDLTPVREYHFEPGDRIKMVIRPSGLPGIFDLEFSGKGAAKYQCKNEFRSAGGSNTTDSRTSYTDLLYGLIEKYKPELSDYSYHLLHADVIGEIGSHIFTELNHTLRNLVSASDSVGFKNVVDSFKAQFSYDFTKNIPNKVLSDSKEYAVFLLDRLRTETLMEFGYINYNALYSNIKKIDNQELKDKMILRFFLEYWSKIDENAGYYFEDALKLVQDRFILARIKTFNAYSKGS